MKKGTKAWLDFAHRDLESSRLLVDSEYVSNVVAVSRAAVCRKVFEGPP